MRKIVLSLILIFLILIAGFFLLQKRTKILEPSRIALVDKVEKNYVFRGNNPLIRSYKTKVFAYKELKNRFNEILEKNGEEPLEDFFLIDVSLLDFNELNDIKIEKSYFEKNPDKGQFINFSTISPALLIKSSKDSNQLSQKLLNDYNQQNTDFLNQLHEIATQKHDKPMVIYLHCNAGRDRTGFMISAYKMLFLEKNLQQVRDENVAEVGRDSKNFYKQAAESYCKHIGDVKGKAEGFCQS